MIVKASCGLNSSEVSFRTFISDKLGDMVCKSSIADPDVWIRPATKLYGEQYYEYILMYVYNLLEISQNAASVIREIVEKFKLKKGRIEPPKISLGG